MSVPPLSFKPYSLLPSTYEIGQGIGPYTATHTDFLQRYHQILHDNRTLIPPWRERFPDRIWEAIVAGVSHLYVDNEDIADSPGNFRIRSYTEGIPMETLTDLYMTSFQSIIQSHRPYKLHESVHARLSSKGFKWALKDMLTGVSVIGPDGSQQPIGTFKRDALSLHHPEYASFETAYVQAITDWIIRHYWSDHQLRRTRLRHVMNDSSLFQVMTEGGEEEEEEGGKGVSSIYDEWGTDTLDPHRIRSYSIWTGLPRSVLESNYRSSFLNSWKLHGPKDHDHRRQANRTFRFDSKAALASILAAQSEDPVYPDGSIAPIGSFQTLAYQEGLSPQDLIQIYLDKLRSSMRAYRVIDRNHRYEWTQRYLYDSSAFRHAVFRDNGVPEGRKGPSGSLPEIPESVDIKTDEEVSRQYLDEWEEISKEQSIIREDGLKRLQDERMALSHPSNAYLMVDPVMTTPADAHQSPLFIHVGNAACTVGGDFWRGVFTQSQVDVEYFHQSLWSHLSYDVSSREDTTTHRHRLPLGLFVQNNLRDNRRFQSLQDDLREIFPHPHRSYLSSISPIGTDEVDWSSSDHGMDSIFNQMRQSLEWIGCTSSQPIILQYNTAEWVSQSWVSKISTWLHEDWGVPIKGIYANGLYHPFDKVEGPSDALAAYAQ